MARSQYGIHRQTNGVVQSSTSGTFLATATASHVLNWCYSQIGWGSVSVGSSFKIVELDASATATLSNTLWIGYFQTTYGTALLNFGEEGLKCSSTGTNLKICVDTSGIVWFGSVGFSSQTK